MTTNWSENDRHLEIGSRWNFLFLMFSDSFGPFCVITYSLTSFSRIGNLITFGKSSLEFLKFYRLPISRWVSYNLKNLKTFFFKFAKKKVLSTTNFKMDFLNLKTWKTNLSFLVRVYIKLKLKISDFRDSSFRRVPPSGFENLSWIWRSWWNI